MRLNLLTLNCRGLNNTIKRKHIFQLCNSASISCLQETYICKDTISKWKAEWPGEFFYSLGSSNSKGLLILFNKCFHLDQPPTLAISSDRLLSVNFVFDSKPFTLTNIYAPHTIADKTVFFDKLTNYLQTHNSVYSIICGDFNTAINPDIDIISGKAHNEKEIKLFQNIVYNITIIIKRL